MTNNRFLKFMYSCRCGVGDRRGGGEEERRRKGGILRDAGEDRRKRDFQGGGNWENKTKKSHFKTLLYIFSTK